ncbi:AMP-binding protein [Conexibacter arvalis]|uniref:O-succinylbenzoic acid--CoA ligase n=1 Tax=Conexibacter arvalis TaxID=912552 RepID=A0A840IFW6_9ACTN|nr:AMP-binding protein [Conexibacter arvalis]MBB4663696.1 O-succinylbenzoic acid--CoA ligase [Conexibacter arvalis]
MDLDAWLPRAAALRPDHPALVTGDRDVTTYAELHAAARRAAAALAASGVGPGDRVAVSLPPDVPFVATLHAVLGLGATFVPLDARLSDAERAQRAAGAAATVAEPLDAGRAERPLAARLDPDAVATLLHTSGTTAAPKPVALTVSNWQWNALGSALALGLDRDERWLCTLPLSHVGGLSILIRSAIYGTTVVLHERFDADRAARALAADGITLVSLVATTLRRTLDAGLDRPPRLRCALIGGGPLPPTLAARAADAGIPAAQTYGMTEACSQVTTSLPGEPETAGRALVGQRVALADDGEILVAGETVAPGAPAADGWLHTGDLGRLDARGRLTVTGRKADTIVSGGENVAPQEVEAALLEHRAVADAGVHARPDPEWGEAVVATVVVRDGHAAGEPLAAELREHVAARLARFKVPKRIDFAAELPRTASGKLLRRQLR